MKQDMVDRNFRRIGDYDVVVNGGGLTGLACAVSLARQGVKVALVERRGAFGWEIGRARRIFIDLKLAENHSQLAPQWRDALTRWGGLQGGHLDPALSELVFDRWVVQSGVKPFFHTWAVDICDTGLIIGTKEGYRELEASVVIETDDAGRLVPKKYKMPEKGGAVTRTFVMVGADLLAEKTLSVPMTRGLMTLKLRPIEPHGVQVDVIQAEEIFDKEGRMQRSPMGIRDVVLMLRKEITELQNATVALVGDDVWTRPAFQIADVSHPVGNHTLGTLLTHERGKVHPFPFTGNNLPVENGPVTTVLAGPWIDIMRENSDTEEIAVINRLLLGEAVACYVQERAGSRTERIETLP